MYTANLFLIWHIGLCQKRKRFIYILNGDQCITYFNWLLLHVVINKHDVKKGYFSKVYQTHNDLLEDQCTKTNSTHYAHFKVYSNLMFDNVNFFYNEVIYLIRNCKKDLC